MHESQQHKRDLTATIETHLSPTHRVLLDALLDKQESLWQPDAHVQRYKLTLLKRFSQSTKPAKIHANVEICAFYGRSITRWRRWCTPSI